VRDVRTVSKAMQGVDFVFHAAALKQVPSCEFYPLEAVKTNILGTENILDAAIENNVKKVICLSTDKAVYPINAMGMSKALMEKVMISKARSLSDSETTICGTRYGNVMASRGSVIPLMVKQIESANLLTITDPNMTRFMMTLSDAIDLVLFAFENARNGEIFVQKAPAATIQTLSDAICKLLGRENAKRQIIGTRHGEKLFETLLSREEMVKAEDMGDYFRIMPDNRDLNYTKFEAQGDLLITNTEEYHSHNTRRLDIKGMIDLLHKLPYFQSENKDGIKVEVD
jgi:UDP-N-acetylglucosamine 4,6-dehydratase